MRGDYRAHPGGDSRKISADRTGDGTDEGGFSNVGSVNIDILADMLFWNKLFGYKVLEDRRDGKQTNEYRHDGLEAHFMGDDAF